MAIIQGFADTISWYDDNADAYASSVQKLSNIRLIEKFADLLSKGAKVLDAGCAAGRDTKLFQERGLIVSGLDLSKSLLAIARKKYPDIEFVYGDFLNIPFKDVTFDGVWAHASLLHLETTDQVSRALSEFNRILKIDGVIHVYVKQQQGQDKTSVVTDSISNHERFFQWFAKDEVRNLLSKAGFAVLEIEDNIVDPGGRTEVKWICAFAKKT